MRIFNHLPGANGHNLSFTEEVWVASLFRFLLNNYEDEGNDIEDIDYMVGDVVDTDKLKKSLDKHLSLYEYFKPCEWYSTPIPDELIKTPNYHIRLLVAFKSDSPLGGPYFRLLWPSQNGQWYYTDASSECVPVDLKQAAVEKWIILED